MKTINLSLDSLTSPEDFHTAIAEALAFPAWYGKNLDALYDCLTDICEPTEIVFPKEAEDTAYLGDYAEKVILVLKDAELDNDDLKVTIK